jgi:predicted transposase/invertase (TIGR01784 family)
MSKKTTSTVEQPIDSERMRYINPYTDFGFKKLFGAEANKELMIDFLQTLLNVECDEHSGVVRPKPALEQIIIKDLRYLNSEQLGRSANDRKAVFDLHCETASGDTFIVEMQRAYQKFFKDRGLYYSTFPIQAQAKKGVEWDYELKPVYMVGIMDFDFADKDAIPDKYLHRIMMTDIDIHTIFYEKLTYLYLEMTKFAKTESELENNFDRWMYALKNLAKLSTRPVALQNRIFEKFFEQAEISQLTSTEYKEYQDALKSYWDYNSTMKSAVARAVEEKDKIIAEKDAALELERQKAATTIAEKDARIVELEHLLNQK